MSQTETLILYHQPLCGFCWSVRDTIKELGIDVELRDVFADKTHNKDLVEARGRAVVPVLRRIDADGHSDWMPESDDIIRYLVTTYG